MADLGAIAVLIEPEVFTFPVCVPFGQIRFGSSEVSGTVLDDEGNPAERIVLAIRRSDGLLVASTRSSPATGAYTLNVAPGEEYTVLFLDDAAGTTYNDIVARVTPT